MEKQRWLFVRSDFLLAKPILITDAEACGIKVQGENKWITLIQNASLTEHIH